MAQNAIRAICKRNARVNLVPRYSKPFAQYPLSTKIWSQNWRNLIIKKLVAKNISFNLILRLINRYYQLCLTIIELIVKQMTEWNWIFVRKTNFRGSSTNRRYSREPSCLISVIKRCWMITSTRPKVWTAMSYRVEARIPFYICESW